MVKPLAVNRDFRSDEGEGGQNFTLIGRTHTRDGFIRLRRVIRWIIRVRQIIRLNLKMDNPPDFIHPMFRQF